MAYLSRTVSCATNRGPRIIFAANEHHLIFAQGFV